MSLVVCRARQITLDVARILDSLLQLEHHAAFEQKYGRGIVCQRVREWDLFGSTFPPVPPGFEIVAWAVDFRQLKVGMEIAFFHCGYTACLLTGVTDDAFTYLHDGVETSMTFRMANKAFLFVVRPGPYMQFVGRDRYTGDLMDLRPLKAGEQMSQTERNIRRAYDEIQNQMPCFEPVEGDFGSFTYDDYS